MRSAARAGRFLYGEGTPLSIIQEIVLASNLLHLQWQMGGGESHTNSPVICRIGNTIKNSESLHGPDKAFHVFFFLMDLTTNSYFCYVLH
jgi:hypothetical protein